MPGALLTLIGTNTAAGGGGGGGGHVPATTVSVTVGTVNYYSYEPEINLVWKGFSDGNYGPEPFGSVLPTTVAGYALKDLYTFSDNNNTTVILTLLGAALGATYVTSITINGSVYSSLAYSTAGSASTYTTGYVGTISPFSSANPSTVLIA